MMYLAQKLRAALRGWLGINAQQQQATDQLQALALVTNNKLQALDADLLDARALAQDAQDRVCFICEHADSVKYAAGQYNNLSAEQRAVTRENRLRGRKTFFRRAKPAAVVSPAGQPPKEN